MNLFNQTGLIVLLLGFAGVLAGAMGFLNWRNSRRLKQQIAGLQDSEKHYSTLVKAVPSVVFKGYADWSVDFFDDKFEKASGYAQEDFASRKLKWDQVILPEDLEGAKAIFKLSLMGSRSYIREYRIRIKSGEVRWIRERAQILCDDQGMVDYVTGTCSDITEEHAMQEALAENERSFRQLIQSVPSVVFKGYADGSVNFFMEDKVKALTGYSLDDFTLRNTKWTDLIIPEDMKGCKEAVKAALKSDNKSYMREYRIKARSGKVHWIRERGQISCNEQGRIEAITGTFSDITEQHELEINLEKLRQQNEMILNSVGEGLFGVDQQGRINFVNPSALHLLGYEADEIMGKNLHELVHHKKPDGSPYPQAECPMFATLTTGEISHIDDEVFWTKNGQPLPVEYLTTPIKQDGQIVGVVGSFRDITWQKQAEAELKKAHQENEMILNAIGEGLFEIDRHGRVIFVNPAAVKLTGYEAEELVGRNLHELTHFKKADGTPYPHEECPIHATFEDGQEHKVLDDVFWTKRGEPLPVAYVTTPIEEDGQVVRVVGAFRDITWRKQAEAEVKKAHEYLEKVFDSSAEGIGIVDRQGLVKKWNKASEDIYGYSFEELQGKPAFDLYADKDELANMLIQLRRDGYVKDYEIRMKRKDGSTFPSSLSVKVLRDELGHNMGSVTVARDLTELKEKEAKLHAANEQLQTLVAETNQRNRNMILLQEMSDVFQSCQTSGETYSAIAHFVPKFFPDYGGALYILNNNKNLFEMTALWGDAASMELVFGQDECWSLRRTRAYVVADSKETINCRHVSTPLPGSYLCVPMMAQGEVMGIFHLRKPEPEEREAMQVFGQFATTVAEAMAMALANLKLRETLRNQAIRDGLTGLFNRRYLEETLERELGRNKRQGTALGVIMLDLDHFKEYNDTYGHNAGDDLLCALGQLIQEGVRREDIACRFGGEEFLLILPGAPLEVALERANELCQGVKRLHLTSQTLKPITISAGVAIFPDHGATGKDVVRAADAALYRAKEEGRDRVIVASSATPSRMVVN